MRALAITGLAAIFMTAASLAFGQPAPAPAPGAEDSKQGRSAGVRDKQRACRQEGQGKGTRGPDLQDYVAVCVAEARLACLKQAIAQKIRGPARREFIDKCLTS